MIIDFFTGKPILEPEKTVHTCTVCGKDFNWSSDSGWYGSYKDAEDGKPIEKYCSIDCAVKSGHYEESAGSTKDPFCNLTPSPH